MEREIATQNVSHDHGITREMYDVSAEYGEAIKRIRQVGTQEDVISEEFYSAAVKLYASAVLDPAILARMERTDRRDALIVLATCAMRWARKVRIGTVPGETSAALLNGGQSHDT